MTTSYDMPYPNEEFYYGERTVVVASVWGNDGDDGPVFGQILVLRPQPPYYEIVEIEWDGSGWVPNVSHGKFFNIVEATNEWQQVGGDI